MKQEQEQQQQQQQEEEEEAVETSDLIVKGGLHQEKYLVTLSYHHSTDLTNLPATKISVFLPNQSVYSILVHHDTLKLYIDGFIRSKPLKEYFIIMQQVLSQGSYLVGNETVKLFITQLSNQNVQIQWKVVSSSVSRAAYILGDLTIPLIDQTEITQLTHQLLWATIRYQQSLQCKLSHCEIELQQAISDRNAAFEDMSNFVWSARERDDSTLLKCMAIINEKKRKIISLQAKLKSLSLGLTDKPDLVTQVSATTSLIPNKNPQVPSADLKLHLKRKRGAGVQMVVSSDEDQPSKNPCKPPPAALGFPPTMFKPKLQKMPVGLHFEVLPLQSEKIPVSSKTNELQNSEEEGTDSDVPNITLGMNQNDGSDTE